MQSSLPRYTRPVRSVMASLALAALVTAGCQQGSDEPESTGSGAPPRPIAGSSTDERPNDVETPPAKPPAAETPAVIPDRPANAVETTGNGKPAASAKADNLPTLDPPATSGAPQETLPTPSAKAERPAEVTPQLSQAVPPASLHPPVVVLSAGHAETCRLKVGDKMPEVTLTDQQGTEQAVAGLLSDKLTVVLFWSMREALGREQFRRLQSETYEPFHQDGLNVIAVHVGEGADDARAVSGSSSDVSLSARYQQIGFHGRGHGEFACAPTCWTLRDRCCGWTSSMHAAPGSSCSTRSITTCLR